MSFATASPSELFAVGLIPVVAQLSKKNKHRLLNGVYFLVAGVGLEPHDLRVMSPTSCQLLYPAIYKIEKMVPDTGLEPVQDVTPTGF